jgi:1,2-phenylacetyl-CoA epoxidase catalytic subunit
MVSAVSYAAWLAERNGSIAGDARTLERREPAMAALESWSWPSSRRVDRAAYTRNLDRRRPETGLSRATLWALCLAKASAAESFGASVGTNVAASSDPHVSAILAHIEAEEAYHARTAHCLLSALGLGAVPPPPDAFTRALVRAMAWMPETWGGAIVVYSGEVTAAALFRLLRRSLSDVFDPGGAAFERAAELIDEVIVDEQAHARFAKSRLSRLDAALSRRLLPQVVRVLERSLPEAALLFGDDLAPEVRSVERDLSAHDTLVESR